MDRGGERHASAANTHTRSFTCQPTPPPQSPQHPSDMLLNVRMEGSTHVGELQLHLKTIIAIKEAAHRTYALMRGVGWQVTLRVCVFAAEACRSTPLS